MHHFHRAYAYERLSMLSEAIRDYTKCLGYQPKCSEAYFNRSNLQYSLGELQAASEDLDKVHGESGKGALQ
jgi:tetratricopeptide (TPR) repeat protein